ncbi:hypothetical protein NEOC84_001359|nr:hypothetical protein [Neochlamydia sp. AcF84]
MTDLLYSFFLCKPSTIKAMKINNLMFTLGCLGFLLGLPFLQAVENKGYTLIEDKASLRVKTPTFSQTQVLKIKLNNGLQAVLISDPQADQSSATMVVEAGSWQDPEQYPGLAHFVEHMLFLGTKKYPNESEFQHFITEHGGFSNAFTANDHTAYMFSIDNEAFPQALDRFASFFKAPLFNVSGISRELKAIDQEYAKNYENDDVREVMVMKHIQNPQHPNYHFNIGNSATLKSASQEILKAWYNEHYSSNIMRLLLVSNLPLEEMRRLTVEEFGDISDKHKACYVPAMDLNNPDMQAKLFYINPIQNIRKLTLVWDLPQEFAEMKDTYPDRLVCQVLGHEGKESLLAQLRREKLAENLGCSTFNLGEKNLVLFVQMDLTDKGVQSVDQVILRCFQTLALMKEKPFPRYIFDEVRQINLLDYEYQQREDVFTTAMKNADLLVRENIATYPEQTKVIQKFSQADVQKLLDYLTPSNCRFLIQAPPSLTGVEPTHQEEWLQVAYAMQTVDPFKMQEWASATPIVEIALPPPNPFLPRSLDLLHALPSKATKLPRLPCPQLIEDSEHGTIYYAKDQHFLIPQLYLNFNIKTPEVDIGDADKIVLADIYVKAVEENLSKFSYSATTAGLNFNVARSDYGLAFKINGYNDHAFLLFEGILKHLKELKLSEQAFKIFKQSVLRRYQNFTKKAPLKRAKELFQQTIYKRYATEQQKINAIRKLSFAKFQEDIQSLFRQSFVEGLIYGNVTENQAKEYADKLIKILDSAPYPKPMHKHAEIIDLSSTEGPFLLEIKIPVQGSAALLAIQNPSFTFKERAAQQILMKAMKEPFFAELRTRQQTGYLVSSAAEEIERKLFLAFAVQSNTHAPRDLLARFELFIESFIQGLDKNYLTPKNFDIIKNSLLEELEKPPHNMESMGALLHSLAFKYEGRFDWIDKRIQALKALTYDELLSFAHACIGKGNKRRLGLLIKGPMDKAKGLYYTLINTPAQFKQRSTFSSSGGNEEKERKLE